jgi:hypothetical protein
MELKKNVVAAITTAVQLYMMSESQVVMVEESIRPVEAPRPSLSPWALSGRQTAMDMRRLWQMRLVR